MPGEAAVINGSTKGCDCSAALLEEIALLGCLAEIGIVHRGERLWGIVNFRRLAAPGTQHGPVVRKGADIHRHGAGARPTKALHTAGHIGLEANAGLFTI